MSDYAKKFIQVYESMQNNQETKDPEIKYYQWTGDNFEAISSALNDSLVGYVYRKEDDLVIDFNDGYSIKRVKPLEWILVSSGDTDDISVMSDSMMKIVFNSRKDFVVQPKPNNDIQELPDKGIDISTETRYGDKIKLCGRKNGYLCLKFKSYHGDNLDIEYSPIDNEAVINLNDRYGNHLYAKGSSLSRSATGLKTSAQLYESVFSMLDNVKSKVLDNIDRTRDCVNNSKKIAL